MKIKINFSPQKPQFGNKKDNLFNIAGDMILCILPGLFILTSGFVFTELWPPMEGLPTPVLCLIYICIIWCSVAVVILSIRIKRWFPTLITCIVLMIVVLLFIK